MELSLYQIDAFANHVFEGNPAAVCPLDQWLPDDVMQSIAMENHLSETAFFVPTRQGFHIRWFTPVAEVNLCGHATLASAFVIFNNLDYTKDKIIFDSHSGPLMVERRDSLFVMDFPSQEPVPCNPPTALLEAFSIPPVECLQSEDYMLVFDTEQDVLSAKPDLPRLCTLDLRGVIITAPSAGYDFVNRFFAPKYYVNEDPVTGSAFTQLAPYWAARLGKKDLNARQVSQRGGDVSCSVIRDRVEIMGNAVGYFKGSIQI
ncbi:MAG: PhzF family phenazine biosynthesis protein [Desulfobacteraceae bacterium]|nr:MAG: PhzF family phenazine biosynthesis protein [Desulfobacteraceae bacterium]